LVGKVDRKARKPWITQEIINKRGEQRKWRNVNNKQVRKNYRRLRNKLERPTDQAKKKYLDSIWTRSWYFQEQDIMI
jgi:hypothetical protein